jgi:hypothetical protein
MSEMDTAQNFREEIKQIDTAVQAAAVDNVVKPEDPRWQILIDYRALSGLVIDYDEQSGTDKIRKMKLSELAEKLSVDPRTLNNWMHQIPAFWERVAKRRTEIGSQSRLAMIEEKWFLKALEMKNWQITEAWMRHYKPDFKESKVKAELDVGDSLAELMTIAAKRRSENVHEGEVVDASQS